MKQINATLSKVRHYVNIKTLKLIYYAIFESHLSYSSLVQAQNPSSFRRLHVLPKNHSDYIFF